MGVKKIRKRDGRIVDFDTNKVAEAIFRAAQSVGGSDKELAKDLAVNVTEKVNEKFPGRKIPGVEEIQDLVEKVLMDEGHSKTAKSYILYRDRRSREREAKRILGVEDDVKLSFNAIRILQRRYLKKNPEGEVIETPGRMFRRVAANIAQADLNYNKNADVRKLENEFYEALTNLDFLPNSPTLRGAGRKMQQLSACFVIPIEDSMEGIFDALKEAALVQKGGGGTGFSFGRLRPEGDTVSKTGGVASGPVSFMKIFDVVGEQVRQGGTRVGANMGILPVDHPDIVRFINCKLDNVAFRNFNISVAITDKFMKALKQDKEFDLINPKTKKIMQTVKAKNVFDLLVSNAWKNGEPGVVFIDKINKDNVTPVLGKIESTNPCVVGESLISTDKGLIRMEKIVEEFELNRGINVFNDNRVPIEVQNGKNSKAIIKGEATGVKVHKINNAWLTGIKPTLKITTDSGRELITTFNHKFLTNNGWVEAEKLKEGESQVLTYDDKIQKQSEEKVAKIEKAGLREVYNLTEPKTHSFIANGFVISNCGEQPLLPYESCNLGSVNLVNHVKIDGDKREVDFEKLKKTTRMAMHFLDNVIDMNKYYIEKIEKLTKANRKIGLGVMGFSDMLIKLEIPYNSEKAEKIARDVMRFITKEARQKSVELAEERGSFPNFNKSIWPKKGFKKLRNATVTTIAPTGTLSILGDCSSGIEPIFAIAYTRYSIFNTQGIGEEQLLVINKLFEEVAKREGFYSEELMVRIAQQSSIQEITEIPEKYRDIFVTTHDINPEWHIRIQAAFQKFVDNAVSKTINFPQSATIEDVENAYQMSFDLGCKGITIYRDKSRDQQILNVGEKKPEKKKLIKKEKKVETETKQNKEIKENPKEIKIVSEASDLSKDCPTCSL
ncbi:MAG: ribonucleotide reductase N-terminal alpha domain-containing protein [archaeon]